MSNDAVDHAADDHDGGLAADLPHLVNRRRLLGLLAGAGTVPLVASRFGGPAAASLGSYAATLCAATVPEETAGPYPGDGSNGPNVLTQGGIVRSDIRASFGSSTTVAQGVLATIKLTLLNAADSCNPLQGVAVYLWHCNRDGLYSLYSAGITGENYLRGVQVTDASGTVTFTSIFPACYSGRWPHIHYEVYPNLAAATSASNKIATSQIALPADACNTVFAASGYSVSISNFSQTSLSTDNVFSDGRDLQLATATGNNSAGWVITNTVAIAAAGITATPTQDSLTPTTSPATIYATSALAPLATPQRFLDTRNAIGYTGSKPAAGSTVVVPVTAAHGVPSSNVSALVFNLTATDTAGWGYVTAWPEGSMPTASTLNYDAAQQTRANLVTIPVGADGSIRLSTSASAHLIGDVVGYYSPAATSQAGRFVAAGPSRILDTRSAIGYSGAKPAAAQTITLPVTSSGASAVVLNVTVTGSAGWGYVTAWPEGTRPETSNVNVDAAGQTIANQVVLPVGSDGAVRLYTSIGAHLIADLVGYYTDASATSSATGLFTPVSPYRVLDSRTTARRIAGSTLTLLAGAAGTAAAGRKGAVLNVTITDTVGDGYVTAWPEGTRTNTSVLNSTSAAQTIACHSISAFGSDGGVRLFNSSPTHLVADVTGWFNA